MLDPGSNARVSAYYFILFFQSKEVAFIELQQGSSTTNKKRPFSLKSGHHESNTYTLKLEMLRM